MDSYGLDNKLEIDASSSCREHTMWLLVNSGGYTRAVKKVGSKMSYY
jgi:hypothetical protein